MNWEFQAATSQNFEGKKRPEKLFRSFTIKPQDLTVQRLRETLRPGGADPNDPTKVRDGNELGVYMSTNASMVETAYATGGEGISHIQVPTYNNEGVVENRITLPSCGVIVEVTTEGLDIRAPKITGALQGVYNNGFQGDEWIADEISPEFYKVKKLILSRWANDTEEFSIVIEDASETSLQVAIDRIKIEFEKRLREAEKFKVFLESLNETQRRNFFFVSREWEKQKTTTGS